MSTRDKPPFATRPPGTFRPAVQRPMVPDVPPVQAAMRRAGALGNLMSRLKMSQECLEVVKSCLPPAMAAHVRSGALDDDGWTLLAANSSVSAKLRQLQPDLMDALKKKGLKVNAIRVRVQKQ